MGHFAKVNNKNIVEQVIVAEQDFIDSGVVGAPHHWIRTSYNTRGGVYYDPATGLPKVDQAKALRKNFAGIGYFYDRLNDAFYPPQPYPSWTLNQETYLWDPPVPMPTEELPEGQRYVWNEDTVSWDTININNDGE